MLPGLYGKTYARAGVGHSFHAAVKMLEKVAAANLVDTEKNPSPIAKVHIPGKLKEKYRKLFLTNNENEEDEITSDKSLPDAAPHIATLFYYYISLVYCTEKKPAPLNSPDHALYTADRYLLLQVIRV
jgi:hypothetical protein